MNRKFKRTTILIVILSLFVFVIPALAQEGGFTETFDDTSMSGWTKIAGDSIVEDGVLKMDPGSMVMKSGNWSDITLTVKFRFEGSLFVVVNYYVTEGHFYSLTVFTETVFVEKLESVLDKKFEIHNKWRFDEPRKISKYEEPKAEDEIEPIPPLKEDNELKEISESLKYISFSLREGKGV